jgi:hypothetical protein
VPKLVNPCNDANVEDASGAVVHLTQFARNPARLPFKWSQLLSRNAAKLIAGLLSAEELAGDTCGLFGPLHRKEVGGVRDYHDTPMRGGRGDAIL